MYVHVHVATVFIVQYVSFLVYDVHVHKGYRWEETGEYLISFGKKFYVQAVVPRLDIPVATGTNMAHAATDIVTSVNEAYHPIESSSDNTEENGYAYITEDEPEYEHPRQE